MNNELIPLKKLLEKGGYEFTWQKEAILKIIVDSNIHLNAKEIYDKVKKESIGLATVYRALKAFKELGIIKEINVNGTNYFEMKMYSGKPLHIHIKCFNCNNIFDVNDEDIILEFLKLNRKVEKKFNMDIYDSNIMLVGLCNDCKNDGEK